MEGLSEGDTFDFMIEKKDGFGDYDESNIIDLPNFSFLFFGKDTFYEATGLTIAG